MQLGCNGQCLHKERARLRLRGVGVCGMVCAIAVDAPKGYIKPK